MSIALGFPLAIAAGYVLGSIPFPYILGKLAGQDLFETGSRKPGAANLCRQVSRPSRIVATLLDMAKGAAAIVVGRWLGVPEVLLVLPGAAAMVGHWYSLFLRFRGGETLAAVIGIALGLSPLAGLAGLATGLIILAVIRNTGRAAGAAWPFYAGVAYWEGTPWQVIAGATALAAIITARSNLRASRRRRDGPS